MFKFTVIAALLLNILLISSVSAGKKKGGKGGWGGGGHGCGGGGCGGGGGGGVPSEINAPVISNHVFKIRKVPSSSSNADIPTIVIGSGSKTLNIQFQSSSSDIQIEQDHANSGPQVMNSHSVDGAIILNQYVKKPIIQNVKEVIIPKRRIVQEVLPVKEFIKTIVSQESNSQTTTSAPEPDTTEAQGPPGYPGHMWW